MANEVEIIVVAKDMTGPTFAKIEKDAKAAGEKAGAAAGSGIKEGIEKAVSGATVGKGTGFDKGGRDAGKKFGDGFVASVAGAAVEAGSAITKAIGAAVSNSSSPITQSIIGTLVAAAVAASPLIAAAIVGAISGASVISVAVGGAILAGLSSPQVQQGATNLKNTILNALKSSSEPFIQPLLESIDLIGERFDGLRPRIDNLFANAAQYVEPFADTMMTVIDDITAGLDTLVERAGDDVMQGVFDGMVAGGEALRFMFEELSTVGPEAGQAIEDTFTMVGNAIMVTTVLLTAFTTAYGDFKAVVDMLTPDEGIEGEWLELSEALSSTAEAYGGIAEQARGAYEAMQEVHEGAMAQIDPMYAIIKAQGDLKEAQNASAEAIRKYGANSQQAHEASLNMAKSAIEMGLAVAEAGGVVDGKLTPSMYAMLAAAKLSAEEIDAVERAAVAAKEQLDGYEGDYKANILVAGAQSAIGTLGRVRGAVYAIPSSKTVVVNVVAQGSGLAYRASGGPVGGEGLATAATGGVRGNMVLVGEQGPEVVKLPTGSTVFPNGQSRRMLADQTWEDAATQKPTGESNEGYDPGAREIVQAISDLKIAIMGLRLYINERAIGGFQGYEADLYGRAG